MAANLELAKQRGISDQNIKKINILHDELESCLNESDEYLRETDRERMFDWFTSIEYALQRAWGFVEDARYHTWIHRLHKRYRELDYLGAVYRCNVTGVTRTISDVALHGGQLVGVGNGFIDFGGVVRIVGNLERIN